MRQVVSSNEIAHLWAHQSQDSACCAANMHFDGVAFYSYDTIIASIVDGVYLVSDSHYSITTTRHQSYVRRAIPYGAKIFFVPGTQNAWNYSSHARILSAWRERVAITLKRASVSREPKKSRLRLEAAAIVSTMRDYVATFNLAFIDYPVIPASVDELQATYADYVARSRAHHKEQLAREKERKRFADMKTAELIGAWCNGAYVDSYLLRDAPTELRIKGDAVETSHGASFPVEHARRGLALVRATIARGETWRANGHTCHLGAYTIDHITPDGTVYAGCHIVAIQAIERIAPALESCE
jgi:hypothetical protein